VSGATDDTDHDGGQDHRTDSQPDAPLGTGRETLLLLVLQAENLVLGELHGGHSGIRGQEERTLGDQAVLTDRADWGARGLGFDHLGGLDRSGDDDDRVVDGRAGGGGRGGGRGAGGQQPRTAARSLLAVLAQGKKAFHHDGRAGMAARGLQRG